MVIDLFWLNQTQKSVNNCGGESQFLRLELFKYVYAWSVFPSQFLTVFWFYLSELLLDQNLQAKEEFK